MIKSQITGGSVPDSANVHKRDNEAGLVVYTRERKVRTLGTAFAVNETLGINMAVNASFGGTPENVHDGTDNPYWTASALTGAWDFASLTNPNNGTKCIEKTTVFDGDEALFSDGGSIDMANYVAVTGFIRLEKFKVNDGVTMQFRLAGVLVGNSVDLLDFVDTGVLNSYQSFAIPKDFMGVGSEVDELIITTVAKPEFRLDDLRVEETGGVEIFTVDPPSSDKLFFVTRFEISLVDELAGTLLNGTMPALSYNKLLNHTALVNGIVIQVNIGGEVSFSFPLRTLGDSLKGGGRLENMISDGTNTCITLTIQNEVPIMLDPRSGDNVRYLVSEDLTGFISISAINLGWQEEFDK